MNYLILSLGMLIGCVLDNILHRTINFTTVFLFAVNLVVALVLYLV